MRDGDPTGGAAVRVDRWLWAARCYKTRTLAAAACNGGKVSLNGQGVKPHKPVRPGDRVEIAAAPGVSGRRRVLVVVALAGRRLPPAHARTLYDDQSPAPVPVKARAGGPRREPGSGRPTKRERRAMERLRGRRGEG